MICEDEVRAALLSVQDFVRSPHFTHERDFFLNSGVTMLAQSVAMCDSITNSAVFEPRSNVETASRSQVVAEVCACVDQAVDRRGAVKDSREQWYAVGGIRPSSEVSASRSDVRISSEVEDGRVETVPVRAFSISVPGPSNLRVSPGKSKKRKISRSPVKRRFEIASPLHHLNSIMWSKIWVLVVLWTASNPVQNLGVVCETEGPLVFSRVDCPSCCYFVSNFENCSVFSLFAVSFVVTYSMNCCFFAVVYMDIYVDE